MQVTLVIEVPSFKETVIPVLKFITGLDEFVKTVSAERVGFDISGAEIDASITASLFSSHE